jgi:penicillin-binding protein 1A
MKLSLPELEKGKYQNIISKVWKYTKYGSIAFIVYLIAVSFNLFWLFGKMPSLEEIDNPKSDVASEIISSDGKVIGKFFYENRSPIAFNELSPNIVNALVATEDVRFTVHSGIDARSTLRVVTGVFTGQRKGGGSTISQQLAKNLFKLRETDFYKGPMYYVPGLRQLLIKTKEWITAIKLERRYTKQEIMEKYLNTIEFSSGAFGIRSAAKTYFKKEPSELNQEEAAILVGMIQNPSRFNPKLHPLAAKNRRNIVFDQMVKYNKISLEQGEMYKKRPVVLNYSPESHNSGPAPYFRQFLKDWLKAELVKEGYTENDIYTKGFKVYTTIDSHMQAYAEEALRENMKDQQKKFYTHWKGRGRPWSLESKTREGKYVEIPKYIENIAKTTSRYRALKEAFDGDEDKVWRELNKPNKMQVFTWQGERDTLLSTLDSIRHYKYFLHSSFLAMDPRNGQIKAWVGGINYKYFKYDHVYQGKRQPGSTFKPFVYVTAIDNGFSTCEQVVDEPITIPIPGGSWTPKNSDGKYSYRSLTLRQALGQSINTVSAYLINKLSAAAVIKYAHKLGIKSELPEVPAICLGIGDVSLYELMAGYCVFANQGKYTEPIFVTKIEDKNGEIIKEYYSDSKEVISQETAYKMIHLMRGATMPGGTAAGLSRYGVLEGNEIAAKTGTTSNFSDGWFMGITPTLVAGGWTGGDDPTIHFRDINLGQGARLSMPTWGGFFQKVYADKTLDYKKGIFLKPSTVSVSGDCVYAAGEGAYIDSTQKYTPPTAKPADDELL